MKTILLVEDSGPTLEVIKRVLVDLGGYTVLEAHSAKDALRICDQHPKPIHLLLCDMMLRDGTGKHVAQRARAFRPELQVLFISGWPQEYLAAKRLLEPYDELLQKPLLPAMLLDAVHAALNPAAVSWPAA